MSYHSKTDHLQFVQGTEIPKILSANFNFSASALADSLHIKMISASGYLDLIDFRIGAIIITSLSYGTQLQV